MTPLRLIATDLDGTLLTPEHRLSQATVDAISAATDAGVEVVLASSRGPSSMLRIIAQLSLTDPVEFISAQGALTARLGRDGSLQTLHEATIPLEQAHAVVAVASRRQISVNWIVGRDWLVSNIDETTEHQISVLGEAPTRRDLVSETRPPHKILLIAPDRAAAMVPSLLASLPAGLAATLSHPTFVEITAQGIDKGVALQSLCARRGISPAEVAVIGDGHNDLAMFDFAGTSIAMANAHPDVLARADLITNSNREDGVATVITALLGSRLDASGAAS